MKKILVILWFVFSFVFADDSSSQGQTGLKKSNDKNDRSLKLDKASEVALIVAKILETNHYSQSPINEETSKIIFNLFIKNLDFAKIIFLEEDFIALKKYELSYKNIFSEADLSIVREANNIKTKRLQEINVLVQKLLSEDIDIEKLVEITREYDTWCKTEDERAKRWAELIQMSLINSYIGLTIEKEIAQENEKKKENKKGSEKNVKSKEPFTNELFNEDLMDENKPNIDYKHLGELPIDQDRLKEARVKMKKNIELRVKRLLDGGEVEVFNVLMNALCNSYDPHTMYHMPEEKETIDIDLSGTLQGIGAQLQEDAEDIKVVKIIPGSPSWKQKQLEPGDIIIKVGQGKQEPVDIRGMRLSDAVRFIRGKKGTEVRLIVKKSDGQVMMIPIIRDVIALEDSFVHSEVVEDKVSGLKIGYMLLPGFYVDQENGKGRSSAADVKKELLALKEKGISGLVFDLRNNGGGSLKDVVEMIDLFVGKSPVVQVRGPNNYRRVLDDPQGKIIYDGPLVVMTNMYSASASEIFAAAIQDYGRGVVLGSGGPTFGKGTVQTFVALQEYTTDKKYDIGALRLTIQKFYRINGQTTQFKGVIPDIVLPTDNMFMKIGERYLENPLPSDLFLPSSYTKWKNAVNINEIMNKSKSRIKENHFFNKIEQQAIFLKKRMDEKTSKTALRTSFEEMADIQSRNQEIKKMKEMKRDISLTRITVLNTGESSMFKSIEAILPKDPYAFEAFDLIKDIIETK